MLKNLKKFFFEEVDDDDEEIPQPKIKKREVIPEEQEHRFTQITIAPELEKPFESEPEARRLYNTVVEPQQVIVKKKPDVTLSGVISPMYGMVTSPIKVSTEVVINVNLEPPVVPGYLGTVISPIHGSTEPEVEPQVTFKPTKKVEVTSPPEIINPVVIKEEVIVTPATEVELVTPVPTIDKPAVPVVDVIPKEPNFVTPEVTVKTEVMFSPYEQPLENDLFGEPVKTKDANTQPEPINFSLFDDEPEQPVPNNQLKRRRKPKSEAVVESFDSLFDDFDANFATTELAKMMEEPDTSELEFNKFELFDGA